MVLIRDADRVLLDAGPFFRFANGGALLPLAGYLGERALITLEVDQELRRNAAKYPELKTLDRMRFPRHQPVELAPEQLEAAEDIRRRFRRDNPPGSSQHPDADRGEIATVLAANQLGGKLCIIDDGKGRGLAKLRQVQCRQSTHLACEMVAAGALSDDVGLRIYLSVYSDSTEPKYRRLLASY